MASAVKDKTATAMEKLKTSGYKALSFQETAATFEGMKPLIAQAVGHHIRPEQIIQAATTLIRNNPAVAACSVSSIMGGVVQASLMQLSLAPALSQAYLVPYGQNAQFQIGYRGWRQLALMAGLVLYGEAIYSNDQFDVTYGSERRIIHKPNWMNRGELIGAYAALTMPNGEVVVKVLNKAEIDSLRQRNSSQKGDPSGSWKTDPEAMYIAKAVKMLKSFIPTKEDFMRTAVAVDEKVVHIADITAGVTDIANLPGYEGAEEAEATIEPTKPTASTQTQAKMQSPTQATAVPVEPVSGELFTGEKAGKSKVEQPKGGPSAFTE